MNRDEFALALCRDYPDVDFFPDDAHAHHAVVICAQCPVRRPCLTYAVNNRIDYGVWGGMSERDRRRLRRGSRRQLGLRGGVQRLLADAAGPVSREGIRDALGANAHSLDTTLGEMVKDGKIARVGRGLYEAVS